jgi:GMP synthase (glutamine-hydrolysing)
MGSVVIVKLGSTFEALASRKGDFEDLIGPLLCLEKDRLQVINAYDGEELPDLALLSGVVLTGSHASVLDRPAWSERTAAWIPHLVRARIPLLGICYGHQLLAHAMGGKVARLPVPEFGTVHVDLAGSAREDPLLGGLPSPMPVHTTHTDQVCKLPPGALRLASNATDSNHAFTIGGVAWGIQFHPEFDSDVVRAYIEYSADLLSTYDLDPTALAEAVFPTPQSSTILQRFGALCAA